MKQEFKFWGETSEAIVGAGLMLFFIISFGVAILLVKLNLTNIIVGLGLLSIAFYTICYRFILDVHITTEKVVVRNLLKVESFHISDIVEVYKNREGTLMVDVFVIKYRLKNGKIKKTTINCSDKEVDELYIFLMENGVNPKRLIKTYK